jgi:hypothetical protein
MTNQPDHALIASAYLQSASELARRGHELSATDGMSVPYAQVLALIATAEAVLALAHEIREAAAV